MHKIWTDFEQNFIITNAPKITDKEGAKQLSAIAGRIITVNAWRKQRQLLGVFKASGRGVCRLRENKVKVVAPSVGAAVAVLMVTGDGDGQTHNDF